MVLNSSINLPISFDYPYPCLSLPAKTDATAAMKNESTTAGPATYFERAPGRTYTPTPMVLPTPNAVRSVVLSTLSNMDDSLITPTIVFFLLNFSLTAMCISNRLQGTTRTVKTYWDFGLVSDANRNLKYFNRHSTFW